MLLVIIFLIISGYLLKYFNILQEDDRVVLNKIVVNIAMPSTIILTILKNVSPELLPQFLKLPIATFTTFVICGVLGYVVGKYLKLPRESLGGLILVCALGNTGFLGYPMIYSFYGIEGLTRAIFCDMGSVFASLLFGTYIGIKFGSKNSDNSVIKEMLKFPPLIASIISILLVSLGISISDIPNTLLEFLKYFSNATIPLIMLSLGLSLSPRYAKYNLSYSLMVSGFRMILSPTVALIISSILLINGLDRNVLILETAMPSAMMSMVFSILYGLDIKLVSSACFITTVLSFIFLPMLKSML